MKLYCEKSPFMRKIPDFSIKKKIPHFNEKKRTGKILSPVLLPPSKHCIFFRAVGCLCFSSYIHLYENTNKTSIQTNCSKNSEFKRYTCFWCNRKYVDLIKHTKNIHPNLSPRSYDIINTETKKSDLVTGVNILLRR